MKTIGDRIREKREALGLSQTELGERLGVSNVSVAHTEANRGNITYKRLSKYADALGCSVTELATDIDIAEYERLKEFTKDTHESANLTPNEQLIIDRYRMLPPKNKTALLGQILTYTESVLNGEVII